MNNVIITDWQRSNKAKESVPSDVWCMWDWLDLDKTVKCYKEVGGRMVFDGWLYFGQGVSGIIHLQR